MTRAAAAPLVIVGASYAGVQLAASARESGFEEPIVIFGDELHLPYQRPPLSKGLLAGKTTPDQLLLRAEAFFDRQRIELRLGTRIDALDLGARSVITTGGQAVRYGWLALTHGARCRPASFPGAAELEGVFGLRSLDDAMRIVQAAKTARRIGVIGGGFIGLEVAAALTERGASVVVLESRPHLLTRNFPPHMSAFVEAAHRARGVDLRTGANVHSFIGRQGRVEAVQLADGSRIDCDMVVLGIGVLPNVELAQHAGLSIDNGIVVDACGRSSAPNVLAAGDVANMASRHAEAHGHTHVRLESIQAANDGARAAASVLVGSPQPCDAVPWFWSDQFDMKFQMAGLHAPGDEVVTRGDMAAGRFSVFYLRRGAIVAAHSVNRPAEHLLSRKLIAARLHVPRARLADESFDLKAALAAAPPVSPPPEPSR